MMLQAKSLELRAATNMGRLLQDLDTRCEARAVLLPVYTWFSEGLETIDWRDAGALLRQLEE
jgi:hypothetical protein